jgi:hypothetical protein
LKVVDFRRGSTQGYKRDSITLPPTATPTTSTKPKRNSVADAYQHSQQYPHQLQGVHTAVPAGDDSKKSGGKKLLLSFKNVKGTILSKSDEFRLSTSLMSISGKDTKELGKSSNTTTQANNHAVAALQTAATSNSEAPRSSSTESSNGFIGSMLNAINISNNHSKTKSYENTSSSMGSRNKYLKNSHEETNGLGKSSHQQLSGSKKTTLVNDGQHQLIGGDGSDDIIRSNSLVKEISKEEDASLSVVETFPRKVSNSKAQHKRTSALYTVPNQPDVSSGDSLHKKTNDHASEQAITKNVNTQADLDGGSSVFLPSISTSSSKSGSQPMSPLASNIFTSTELSLTPLNNTNGHHNSGKRALAEVQLPPLFSFSDADSSNGKIHEPIIVKVGHEPSDKENASDNTNHISIITTPSPAEDDNKLQPVPWAEIKESRGNEHHQAHTTESTLIAASIYSLEPALNVGFERRASYAGVGNYSTPAPPQMHLKALPAPATIANGRRASHSDAGYPPRPYPIGRHDSMRGPARQNTSKLKNLPSLQQQDKVKPAEETKQSEQQVQIGMYSASLDDAARTLEAFGISMDSDTLLSLSTSISSIGTQPNASLGLGGSGLSQAGKIPSHISSYLAVTRGSVSSDSDDSDEFNLGDLDADPNTIKSLLGIDSASSSPYGSSHGGVLGGIDGGAGPWPSDGSSGAPAVVRRDSYRVAPSASCSRRMSLPSYFRATQLVTRKDSVKGLVGNNASSASSSATKDHNSNALMSNESCSSSHATLTMGTYLSGSNGLTNTDTIKEESPPSTLERSNDGAFVEQVVNASDSCSTSTGAIPSPPVNNPPSLTYQRRKSVQMIGATGTSPPTATSFQTQQQLPRASIKGILKQPSNSNYITEATAAAARASVTSQHKQQYVNLMAPLIPGSTSNDPTTSNMNNFLASGVGPAPGNFDDNEKKPKERHVKIMSNY